MFDSLPTATTEGASLPLPCISRSKMPLVPAVPEVSTGNLPSAEIERALGYAENEKAEATRKAYRADAEIWGAWCRDRGLSPLPASPEALGAFLAAEADAGRSASTITRRLAAIGYAHKLAGLESPTSHEAVRAVLRGIRRTIGTTPDQKAPAEAALVRRMIEACPDNLIGLRDQAILAIGFAGALRRSEIAALGCSDIREIDGGIELIIRHSKGDQESAGQTIAIPFGTKIQPVAALRAWLAAAGISEGPLFRSIRKGGAVQAEALSTNAIAEIIKEAAERAGLPPDQFSGHSLRAGFLTSAAKSGASIFKMMEVSRHRRIETLQGYVRDAERLRDHAGGSFL
ncbi:MAG TPA: site-specific integrase [Acetobacteraceae bacterium]|nr:site-specific integrase [Acetobacteraceae bacterium]